MGTRKLKIAILDILALTKGRQEMNDPQIRAEIRWLENRIETLKQSLTQRPSVATQIRDLQRQIRERELRQVFEKNS